MEKSNVEQDAKLAYILGISDESVLYGEETAHKTPNGSDDADDNNETADELWLYQNHRDIYPLVSEIPDQRSISETTLSVMKIRKWSPWATIREEFETLDLATERGDPHHTTIYHFLLNLQSENVKCDKLQLDAPYPYGAHMYQTGKPLLGLYAKAVNAVTKPDFVLQFKTVRNMTSEFYQTYPTISYALSQQESTLLLALAIPHPKYKNMIKKDMSEALPYVSTVEVATEILKSASIDGVNVIL